MGLIQGCKWEGPEDERSIAHIGGCEACSKIWPMIAEYAQQIQIVEAQEKVPDTQGGLRAIYAIEGDLQKKVMDELAKLRLVAIGPFKHSNQRGGREGYGYTHYRCQIFAVPADATPLPEDRRPLT